MGEEEEPMQGKFDPVQKMGEEEEPMQGKFDPVQKMGEEEEPMQGKFDPVQKMGEEEEPMQGKFDPVQKVGEEEEPMQGKFDPVQRVGEEEEPMQGKFEPVQRKTSHTVQLEDGDSAASAAKAKNKTGLPDNLKSGIENISGIGIDDVKVHYNSEKPSQLKALAYAQGTDIHVAPGQEKHVPHEAWHVVQQKQGRVKPTMQMKQGVPVNDDAGLEHEADVMGAQALAKGNAIGAVQKKEAIQLKAIAPVQRKPGIFGEDYDNTRKGNAELAPGMGMMESGIGMSGRAAMTGAEKSWDLASAPARWASKGMAGTDSKLKKAGYGIAGGIGSLFSGAAGAVGAAGSAIGGLAGAAISGTAGAITTGLGGLWMGAKAAGSAIKGGIMGLFKGKKKSEQAANALLLSSAAPMAAGTLAGEANRMAGYSGNNAPSLANGLKGGLSGSGQAIGSMGAAAGLLGAASSIASAGVSGQDAMDSSLGTHKRVEAGAASLSAIAQGTKSAASAAYNIATLVNANGPAAAGAAIAASGASIAMGAIDILRGGYGIWTATQRETILKAIADGAEKEGNGEIGLMARTAMAKQDSERDAGIGNVAKGVLAVAGGAAMIIAAASPVGWVLLGLGAVVGGIMLLVNKVKAANTKKEVVADMLGVKEEKKAYEAELAQIEKDTWWGTDARKAKMKEFKEKYPVDPLTKKVAQTEEKTVDALYDKHIHDTATMLYAQAVDPVTANLDPTNEYVKIIEGLGLKIKKDDPKNPQPSIAKIKKAISV
ncbi:MAG: DUF4157 domain-containing protein [Bacteroidota bacterium]